MLIAVESLRWESFHCQSGSTTVPRLSSTEHIVCRGLYPVHTLTASPSLPIVPTRFRHMSTVQPDSQGTPVAHVSDMCSWPLLPVVDPSHSWRLSTIVSGGLFSGIFSGCQLLMTLCTIQLFSGLKGGLTGGLLKESRCSCVTDDQM